jgi:hypothetical integral membrane protein (TIGR02206 family)
MLSALLSPATRVGEEFTAFSLTHAVTVAACVVVTVVLGVLGANWRDRPAGKRLRWFWAAFVLLVQLANLIYFAVLVDWEPGQPLRVDWKVALPLHVCDLAGLVAILVMLIPARILRTTLYYWAVGLTTQAFITPVLGFGPNYWRFWLFWLSHLTITATAVYLLAAERYRPTWRDYGVITLVMLGYGAVVIPVDAKFDLNYGFAGKAANLGTPTILDYLGPWPLRLVFMFLIMEAVFAVITVVWWRPRKTAPAQSR